jgi:hypothetical protein
VKPKKSRGFIVGAHRGHGPRQRTPQDLPRRQRPQILSRHPGRGGRTVWLRVRLGGERRVDVARAYGYKDGSAITHLLKRSAENEAVQRLLTALEAEYANRVSSVKSRPPRPQSTPTPLRSARPLGRPISWWRVS